MRLAKRLVLGVTLFLVLGAADDAFKRFDIKDLGFSQVFPKAPERETKTLETPSGPLTMVTYSAGIGDVIYMVIRSPIPAERLKTIPAKTILDDGRDGALAKLPGSKLLGERAMLLRKKYPGREVKILTGDGKIQLTSRFYLVRQDMYQIIVGGPPDQPSAAQRGNWLDSFRLIP